LQLYIESILAIERKYGKGKKLPLCIMTSNATNTAITELLRDNDNFGMLQKQITIVNQGTGVPIFEKSENKLVLNPKDEFNIQTATHGQGDVHTLLRKHRVVEKWYNEGIEWLMFLEDTNGLAFHNLALMLGMSVKHTLTMNMVAFPRKAKQATESIVKLINEETKETRTISVDYEQFDPLLRAHGYTNGDEADEATGYSPFPGSTNHQFVFNLKRYLAIKGTVPEFVVKAKDGASAHLECRMQDISSILTGRDALKVGYTCVPTEHCFSPVDTTAEDGAKLQQSGMIPRCAASGEADQYAVHAKLMRSIGCEVEMGETDTFNGVSASPAPQIIIKPDTACFPGDYSTLFPHPERIKISSRSSLVVSGPGVVIESLTLDGALVIEGNEKVEEQVVKNLVVKNDGWTIVKDDDCVVEDIAMRGYHLEKKETKKVVFSETILDKVARLSKCG
jgi:UDP-sugar pyrophosphorylase